MNNIHGNYTSIGHPIELTTSKNIKLGQENNHIEIASDSIKIVTSNLTIEGSKMEIISTEQRITESIKLLNAKLTEYKTIKSATSENQNLIERILGDLYELKNLVMFGERKKRIDQGASNGLSWHNYGENYNYANMNKTFTSGGTGRKL